MSGDDDRTKLRIPGAPRAAPPPVPASSAPPPPAAAARPAAPVAPSPPAADPYAPPADAAFLRAAGSTQNPLLEAALPLLLLAVRLRGATYAPDVPTLQRRVADEIRAFEADARGRGVRPEDVLAARYALCTLLDESVLNTPWGAHGGWATQPLLIAFHREAFGGEKFFQIVDRVSAEPQRYVDLLEVLYACLAAGFEGRYKLSARGPAELADIQRRLGDQVRGVRGAAERELSPTWRGATDARPKLIRWVPLWAVGVATATLLVLGFFGFYATLGTATGPVNASIDAIGAEAMYTGEPAPSTGPTLAALLAPEATAGRVQLEEVGGRTVVRLTVQPLFASGSAELTPAALPAIRAIAQAMAQVPGRAVVVGHTDDQPVRSLQFADNYELSRARAQAVVGLLQKELGASAGLTAIGRGADFPLAEPANAPENRARNRRVEIVHQAGG